MKYTPRPLSVLVVEDHADTAQSTADLLVLYGHRVRVARCGEDAVRAAAAEAPDVVLLDLGLPGMDGWQVARRLRARPRGKQPVVVAVSGYDGAEDRVRSADAGVDLHLAKPVEPAVLVGMLRRFREALAPPVAAADTGHGRRS
jgi:CheY-like chemotaxis protein